MTRDEIARALAAACQGALPSEKQFEDREAYIYGLGTLEAFDRVRIELGITPQELQAACAGVVHSTDTPDEEFN